VASILKGDRLDPIAGKVRPGTYAAGWIDRRSDLRPSTVAKYKKLLRLQVDPDLGHLELAKIAPSSVRQW